MEPIFKLKAVSSLSRGFFVFENRQSFNYVNPVIFDAYNFTFRER